MIKLRNLALIIANANSLIRDINGDTVIDIDTAKYVSSNDGGNSTDNNRSFVFINITGDVYLEGNRLMIILDSV